MDPHSFERMIRRLSPVLSRRSLVGGSLGAAALATVGLGADTSARRVSSEECLPANRRCGYTKKRNDGTRERIKCSKCCQGYFQVNARGRKKCSCRPNTVGCNTGSQCCSGFCGDNVCQESPCPQIGESCSEPEALCCFETGRCNNAGVCVRCSSQGESCDPADPNCCVGTGLSCDLITRTCQIGGG
jgi:hypothetical protein